MTFPQTPRHVEIRDGSQIVAAAEVSMPAAGTARTSLRAVAGHLAPGRRADLVDTVMDLPEVRASQRLEATIPLGDVEFLQRLRERTTDAVIRPAETRAQVTRALRALRSKRQQMPPKKHGNIPL